MFQFFLLKYVYCEILEQFGTGKLDKVENLCKFCQFFLSEY